MPDAYSFRRAFGLITRKQAHGWKILRANSDHIQVAKYKKYRYPIRVTMSRIDGKPEEALESMNQLSSIFNGVIVNSRYGNPYVCEIHNWMLENVAYKDSNCIVTLTAEGTAVRSQ